MTPEELRLLMRETGQPEYRAKQIFNWMYNHLCDSFDEMQNIPKALRNLLSEKTILNTLDYFNSEKSEETGTTKYLFKTKDDNLVETVVIPEGRRITLCLSTQVGCPLDCKFCATGLMGYKKNLTAGEIFDQYKYIQKHFDGGRITNIVYMGMGEPLLNFRNTVKSLQIFGEEMTTGITLKKITVSTAGISPKIKELADTGLDVKLAFSLHSCFEDIRSLIMPVNHKYSLDENISALKYYTKKTSTRITFEYVMLKDINDRPEDIKALVKLCSLFPSKINLIPFNSLKHMNPEGLAAELKPTRKEKIFEFAERLREKNITVMVRLTQGDDIAAACGQLAIKNN